LFSNFKRNIAASRLLEERLYAQVLDELERGIKRQGLWAKAIANSDGVESKAKSIYIKYRLQSMKDEAELLIAVNKEAKLQEKEEEKLRAEEESKARLLAEIEKNKKDKLAEEPRKAILAKEKEEIRKLIGSDFNLSKVKSAVIRGDISYIELLASSNNHYASLKNHKQELSEMAELFDAIAIVDFFKAMG
jgi:hypothetical protein